MTLDDLEQLSSPVAVAVRIRQDLAEFQRTGGSRQALLESLRADYILHCGAAHLNARDLQQQATSTAGGPATVVEHLEQQGLIHRDPRHDPRRRRRLFSVINNPSLSKNSDK
jgi:hypothetical protein